MVAQSITLPIDDEGRVTIPDETRRELGIKPGDQVRISVIPPLLSVDEMAGIVRTPPGMVADDDDAQSQLSGLFKHAGSLRLVEELRACEELEDRIREVMEEAAIRRYQRSL